MFSVLRVDSSTIIYAMSTSLSRVCRSEVFVPFNVCWLIPIIEVRIRLGLKQYGCCF